jgi:hypothetical protein
MTALEAAQAHLHRNHGGDARHALWKARQCECSIEPLPEDLIRCQSGFAWIGATAEQYGIVVVDEGGAVELVPWDSIITNTKEHAA